jgi:hypothetical protein
MEHPLEVEVSRHIGFMPGLWLEVNDTPGPESARGHFERNAIDLLSNLGRPSLDAASPSWLDGYPPRRAIREFRLWNIRHVSEEATAGFATELQAKVRSARADQS